MIRKTTPGPVKGRKSLSKLGGEDNTPKRSNFKPPFTGKNRLLVLESIAIKWAAFGLYQSSPTRAMAALLEGIDNG